MYVASTFRVIIFIWIYTVHVISRDFSLDSSNNR